MTIEQAYLPYAGSSGHSGSETSRERAERMDSDGTTRNNQEKTGALLVKARYRGMTWKELSEETGWHHGTASGVLSVLNKAGAILRLKEKRGRCAVYVLPAFRSYREVSLPKPRKTCHNCGAKQ